MATIEKLTIQFEGKGAPKLTGQLNSLSAAMNRLAARQVEVTKSTKRASKATDSYNQRLTKNGRNVNGITETFGKFGKKMSQIRSKLLIVAFAVGVVSKVIMGLTKSFAEFAAATNKINTILASTGGVSGKTSRQLQKMADTFQNTFAVSNTAIMEMQTRLLTFTNITGGTFDRTAKAALNLSTVFGQDLNQATIQVGKAINDPIKGYTALRRIGVSFSADQVKSIKQFQEQGDVIAAQNVILKELERELGNAAEASLQGAYGSTQWKKAMNDLSDAGKELGNILQPLLFSIAGTVRAIGIGFKIVLGSFRQMGEHLGLVVKHWTNFRDMASKSDKDIRIMEERSQQIQMAASWAGELFDAFANLEPQYKKLAESSGAWTPSEELANLRKEALALVDEGKIDEAQDKFDLYTEAVTNNRNVIQSYSTAQDLFNEKSEELTQKLKDMITVQALSTEQAKMEWEMGQRNAQGIKVVTDAQKKLIAQYLKSKQAIEDKIQAQKDEQAEINKIAAEIRKEISAQESSEKSLKKAAEALAFKVAWGREMTETEKLMSITTRDITADEWKYAEAIDNSNKKLAEKKRLEEEAIQADKDAAEVAKTKAEIQQELTDQAITAVNDFAQARIDSIQAQAEAELEIINEQMNFELDSLRQSTAFRLANDKNKRKAEEKIQKDAKKREDAVKKEARDEMKKMFHIKQAVSIAEAIMNTYAGVTNALKNIPAPANIGFAAAIGAMGFVQVAGIAAQKPPTMQYGGLIGGQPHSRGGTMIEAERGEFVMSKKAVDAVGLETMNRINAGGSTGDVNISFSGNVMSKDFIEDEAVPQIKEALRRGGDIGVG